MNETITVLVRFKIGGNLRFLSHAETMRVFQRACVRAGIKVAHSQGFNPRPKMSMPLPRSVGVETDDDLLMLRVCPSRGDAVKPEEPNDICHTPDGNFDAEAFKAKLSGQLPKGLEPVAAEAAKEKLRLQPRTATYILAVKQEYISERLKTTIEHLLANKSLELERRINENGRVRKVDVRSFLKKIELNDEDVVVECEVGPAGSIRIDEILKLLELDYDKLTAPIRRTNVQWG